MVGWGVTGGRGGGGGEGGGLQGGVVLGDTEGGGGVGDTTRLCRLEASISQTHRRFPATFTIHLESKALFTLPL